MRGKLESGYELHRMRLGLGAADNKAEKGIVLALVISIGGVAVVAGFIYYIGTLHFWR